MATVLDDIAEYKLREISHARSERPLGDIEGEAKDQEAPRGFASALITAINFGKYGLICEIKKASPSKGLIRENFDPPALAQAYHRGGATCLSVLTDGPSFQGSPDYLRQAKARVPLPILRKDFMFDPYQVIEARAWGADCILIIMAAVSDGQAQELEAAAMEWDLDVLIEVHNEKELSRALNLASPLVGINNRNLHTFETELATTEQLAKLIPKGRIAISESGINDADDLSRLSDAGANCFLIGESLMRQEDVEQATRDLLETEVER